MKYHLLLLEDIINHGRKGELVHAVPGYARNYLLPQGKAVLASHSTVRMRERLQKERDEQAAHDRKESNALAEKLKGKILDTVVKVDPEGHMYGSVTTADISQILDSNGFKIDKKNIVLMHPIRQIGMYQVNLMLPEQVEAFVGLEVKPDRKIEKKALKKGADTEGAASDEASTEGAGSEVNTADSSSQENEKVQANTDTETEA